MDRYSQPSEPFVGAEVINEHALALGHLCIYWATLDNVLASFLEFYLNIDEKTAACIAAPDTSSRCEAIRRLAFVTGPDGEWRDCLIRILNRIQGELAEERNRYIHDDWSVSEAGMVRIDRRPKIVRPQSRQPQQLVHKSEKVTPVEWVDDLTKRVTEIIVAMSFLTMDMTWWRRTGKTRAPVLPALEASNYKRPERPNPPAPTRWKPPLEP